MLERKTRKNHKWTPNIEPNKYLSLLPPHLWGGQEKKNNMALAKVLIVQVT
jgi:hypothetical protein